MTTFNPCQSCPIPDVCKRHAACADQVIATCERCGRPLAYWPLKRPALCSPARWVYCIRPVEGA